jgi:hypothetical protein
MVKLKNEEGCCDVWIWEWFLKLIKYIEADGMSSEESGVEINDKGIVQKVYWVKIMPWWRNINQELTIINKACLQERACTQKLGQSLFCRSAVSRMEQVATNHSVIFPGPFTTTCGLITSMLISATTHFEYPKNNSIGSSVLLSRVECVT